MVITKQLLLNKKKKRSIVQHFIISFLKYSFTQFIRCIHRRIIYPLIYIRLFCVVDENIITPILCISILITKSFKSSLDIGTLSVMGDVTSRWLFPQQQQCAYISRCRFLINVFITHGIFAYLYLVCNKLLLAILVLLSLVLK